jgi:hypothetical protein
MTDEETLAAALKKAIALCEKVEKLNAKLPPKKKGALNKLLQSTHSVAGNLGEALRIKKG